MTFSMYKKEINHDGLSTIEERRKEKKKPWWFNPNLWGYQEKKTKKNTQSLRWMPHYPIHYYKNNN